MWEFLKLTRLRSTAVVTIGLLDAAQRLAHGVPP
jgi:hypothetical protein